MSDTVREETATSASEATRLEVYRMMVEARLFERSSRCGAFPLDSIANTSLKEIGIETPFDEII